MKWISKIKKEGVSLKQINHIVLIFLPCYNSGSSRLSILHISCILTQISSDIRELITEKVNNINQSLANTRDDLPPMSVSVGIAMYEEGINLSTMYKRADEALYTVKENGRSGCSFYESNQGL